MRASHIVRAATPEDGVAVAAFAALDPLVRNDLASVAPTLPPEPVVWIALDDHGQVVAGAIDDGLAISLAGDVDGAGAILGAVTDVRAKLAITGEQALVRAIAGRIDHVRVARHELLMSVGRESVLRADAPAPIRVAAHSDLPVLVDARIAALEEEYGMNVDATSSLHSELVSAIERAVAIRGVAIWVEDERCAFTAQLVAKTPVAATFGDLYVDPAFRGRGVATRALSTFCDWLTTESDHVTLRVGVENDRARRLYDRVGFVVVESFTTLLDPEHVPGTLEVPGAT